MMVTMYLPISVCVCPPQESAPCRLNTNKDTILMHKITHLSSIANVDLYAKCVLLVCHRFVMILFACAMFSFVVWYLSAR